jgi:hypothetical protein
LGLRDLPGLDLTRRQECIDIEYSAIGGARSVGNIPNGVIATPHDV